MEISKEGKGKKKVGEDSKEEVEPESPLLLLAKASHNPGSEKFDRAIRKYNRQRKKEEQQIGKIVEYISKEVGEPTFTLAPDPDKEKVGKIATVEEPKGAEQFRTTTRDKKKERDDRKKMKERKEGSGALKEKEGGQDKGEEEQDTTRKQIREEETERQELEKKE